MFHQFEDFGGGRFAEGFAHFYFKQAVGVDETAQRLAAGNQPAGQGGSVNRCLAVRNQTVKRNLLSAFNDDDVADGNFFRPSSDRRAVFFPAGIVGPDIHQFGD